MQNITPIIDGLPHSSGAKSSVEKTALKIVEHEREIEHLRGQLLKEKSRLADMIMTQVNDPTLQTLLILRYVACCSFKETARRMRYGIRYVFKLHENFLKEGIYRAHVGHIASLPKS